MWNSRLKFSCNIEMMVFRIPPPPPPKKPIQVVPFLAHSCVFFSSKIVRGIEIKWNGEENYDFPRREGDRGLKGLEGESPSPSLRVPFPFCTCDCH